VILPAGHWKYRIDIICYGKLYTVSSRSESTEKREIIEIVHITQIYMFF